MAEAQNSNVDQLTREFVSFFLQWRSAGTPAIPISPHLPKFDRLKVRAEAASHATNNLQKSN